MSTNCKLWDIAAGWVLVTVAAGIVSTPEGEPLFPLDLAAYAGEELRTLMAGVPLHRRSVRSWQNRPRKSRWKPRRLRTRAFSRRSE